MTAVEAQLPEFVELSVPPQCHDYYRKAGELVRRAANTRAIIGDDATTVLMDEAQALYQLGHVLNPYINAINSGE